MYIAWVCFPNGTSKREMHSSKGTHLFNSCKNVSASWKTVSSGFRRVPTHSKDGNKQLEISDFGFILLLFCVNQLFLRYLYIAAPQKMCFS